MDKEQLTQLLGKIDIEHYLSREGLSYQHSYGTRGLQLNLDECPECGEGGRKTYINAETGLGNCFHGSCGAKFNKFKLIRSVSKLSGAALTQHIKVVAEEQGWMPKLKRKEIKKGALELPSKLIAIPDARGNNHEYLAARGITPASCAYFDLSYCHKGWWGCDIDGDKKWVSYDERIVIPITNLEGTLVSFQGRDTTGEKIPKYLFPMGFAVAGSHIYNGHNFIEKTHNHLIVGEGAFDAIAIHQALQGHAACNSMLAVATFGMHLSSGPDGQVSKFVELKKKGLKTVTMMWDGESRAVSQAVKAGLTLASLGFKVNIARLPEGKDPNEISPADVRKAIFSATHLTRLKAISILVNEAKCPV